MPNGIVIIDKPSGWTSMDVCAKLRGILHEKRVGHAGTLDPMATGVLPVFVGQATKAVSFAEDGRKEYIALLQLGVETDTQDSSGRVLATHPVRADQEALEALLPTFTGPIAQIPPMYSAINVNGQKLYALARKGQSVERKPRSVTIYELELVRRQALDCYVLRILCSKGTYIRTLCHDLGQALGCGGCMASLRRTMAAGYTLGDAITLEEVQEQGAAALRPTDSLFAEFPALTLSAAAERRVRCGNPVGLPQVSDGRYRLYGGDGTFLCLSDARRGQLTAVKNFFGVEA